MQPRILFRTHYQVDEPALMELLVKSCTSPVRSAYDESVSEKLTREVRARGKDFNVAAAAYALDLGRGLLLLNEQNAWTEKGHLVSLVADIPEGPWDVQTELNGRERLLHFRLFLEADGAVLLFLARYLLAQGRVPSADADWNRLAQEVFVEAYTQYFRITGTTADRVSLRTQIDRIRHSGYTGKSGCHKLFIHLQTLYRLGLLDRSASGLTRRYELPEESGGSGLRLLSEAIPDLHALERVIQEHSWAELATKVFKIRAAAAHATPDALLCLVAPRYQQVMATGVPLCSLATLIEAVQIELLVQRSELLPYGSALQLLQEARAQHPGDVRFHVDRRGIPAFVKLADRLLASV